MAYREKNDRGGHDLTPDGWQVVADMQREFSTLTDRCAELAKVHERTSPTFQAALVEWQQAQVRMLLFLNTGAPPS